jgi:hypothetical protein
MGMYTELHFEARLRPDEDQLKIIQFLFGECKDTEEEQNKVKELLTLPDHEFFTSQRWDWMMRGGSSYFDKQPRQSIRQDSWLKQYWHVSVTCNIKDYDNEIEKFLDWVMPLVEMDAYEFLGYTRYEEHVKPTFIWNGGDPFTDPQAQDDWMP